MQAGKWQNRIIITLGLLWHLCMPGERHSQTPEYGAGHTLPSEWSQGNNLAASEAFWPVLVDNIAPCNYKWTGETKSQQYNFHLLRRYSQKMNIFWTVLKRMLFSYNVEFGIPFCCRQFYKMLPNAKTFSACLLSGTLWGMHTFLQRITTFYRSYPCIAYNFRRSWAKEGKYLFLFLFSVKVAN